MADRMRFIDRQVLALSPELGEKLTKGFITESSMPKTIERAIEENGSLNKLKEGIWDLKPSLNFMPDLSKIF